VYYEGSSALTLDEKGRLLIPTRYRDDLIQQCTGKLTLTCKPQAEQKIQPDLCLLVYPQPLWEEKREILKRLPMEAEHLQSTMIGNAQSVEMDKAGRILIPPELRELGLLKRDVALVGMGAYFELRDAVEHKRRQAEDRAKPIPASVLASFSLG